MEVLLFAFQDSLQDTAIAKRMNVSERTVQYYWTKIRDDWETLWIAVWGLLGMSLGRFLRIALENFVRALNRQH